MGQLWHHWNKWCDVVQAVSSSQLQVIFLIPSRRKLFTTDQQSAFGGHRGQNRTLDWYTGAFPGYFAIHPRTQLPDLCVSSDALLYNIFQLLFQDIARQFSFIVRNSPNINDGDAFAVAKRDITTTLRNVHDIGLVVSACN